MSLFRKYVKLSVASLMGMVSVVEELPTVAQTGNLYIVQNTGVPYVYSGITWEPLAVDGLVYYTPPKKSPEQLDYENNVKPFLAYVSTGIALDKADLIRGILKAKKRAFSSSRFIPFS